MEKKLSATDTSNNNTLRLNKDFKVKEVLLPMLTIGDAYKADSTRGTELEVWDVDTRSLHTVLLMTCERGVHYIKGNWNMDFNKRRNLNADDIIRLSWDAINYRFEFRVLHKENNGGV